MDFTREPIIETVITPKEGCKLVIRNSKGVGQEEHFVDSIEVVSFGNALFFRSLERPKAFMVPVTDYEVLEVREARMVLKHVAIDRNIRIGGGREGGREPRESEGRHEGRSDSRRERPERSERPERAERPERSERAERSERPERAERAERPDRAERSERAEPRELEEDDGMPDTSGESSASSEGRGKRDRRRNRRRRGGRDEPRAEGASVSPGNESFAADEEAGEHDDESSQPHAEPRAPVERRRDPLEPSTFAKMIPPPSKLISESLEQLRELPPRPVAEEGGPVKAPSFRGEPEPTGFDTEGSTGGGGSWLAEEPVEAPKEEPQAPVVEKKESPHPRRSIFEEMSWDISGAEHEEQKQDPDAPL